MSAAGEVNAAVEMSAADEAATAPWSRALRLPLTYDECRARFRLAATQAGVGVRNDALDARGPDGQTLTIDSVHVGDPDPRRALVVLSGVHGVEGFIGSAVQCDLLARLASRPPAPGTAVLVVHAVNPWGMAWGRRQNEANVDLNRNWRRDEIDPPPNEAYDHLHDLACPDTADLPSVDDLVVAALDAVERHGLAWVRDGITRGQYTHPDGLHFGGTRTEASCRIVADVVDGLVGVEDALVIDLHTGHGPRGELTLLSDQPPGSPQDGVLRRLGVTVEPTVDNPDATTGPKVGQIANGIRDLLGAECCHATSAEFGTAPDEEQLAATYLEQWVYRRGDPTEPAHAEVRRRYRDCFTPDDAAWERQALAAGAALMARALAVSGVHPELG